MTQNTSPLPIEIPSETKKQSSDKKQQPNNASLLPIQTKSPSGNRETKEELFDFPTTMKKVAEGKKISKKEWKNNNIYGEMKEERLILHKEDGKDYAWIISDGDLKGEDWFIID